ncbi:metallophosphoesterase [Humibacter ginsenosidimutans]|uniref:Metallophosphoesterase n=1 Tax=Humibacter ginsenosidimutans TaxID=2599293 RepID=A0A5B8M823_9MICO|nr:metallophosphoesterase [Humibacter ginsenosidimutans]QDZ16349.1 metallophosphoesterase [Humibacter ginsenosidimutans]
MAGRRGASAIGTVALALGAASTAAVVWGTLIERRAYVLRQVSAPVLPSGSKPIRVLHLSDLHMAPWQRDKQRWIRSLAAYMPDLVIDTGDNLGHERGFDGVRYALEPFAGIPGAFVNGSNDYYGPVPKNPMRYFTGPSSMHVAPANLDTAELTGFFDSELGWADLNNHAEAITVNGTRLELFGVDDPHRNFDRLDVVTGELDELRASEVTDAAWPDSADAAHDTVPTVSIGVAHAPYRRILDSFVTNGAAMIFAGHTHGGQVCVPGFGALVTNCDIPRRQVKGLSVWTHALRAAYLNVSAGLGTSIYAPVRFACRPEATLITLVPQDAHIG